MEFNCLFLKRNSLGGAIADKRFIKEIAAPGQRDGTPVLAVKTVYW